ncbi:hypothetical protein HYPBUDRAFT_107532 [Hyphopichia burtonii NRRL Y-1933]|uniref:Uncharacterized protein n=1 Tax=Hyphopichia burtonii NRRL Y-1933 TaxID=984485 RepID=A0A1E4RK18_9ASCO|nr:hypothetical protein HYPBUDRAFT_107532 [Hyphopichia burtonii NRRL Y-1933]ODV67570.1 hypothetical protein HYPBUDRAFT_107532 [Hyphopichia burtonii NRRL Y-1933]
MYSIHMKAPTRTSSVIILGYLAISTTLPFLLSYKESIDNTYYTKGNANARSLFNKI